MKNDDGRLWVLGALGLVAAAGAIATRKGSADRKFLEVIGFGDPGELLWYGGGVAYEEDGVAWLDTWQGLEYAMTLEEHNTLIEQFGHWPTDQEVYGIIPMPIHRIRIAEDVLVGHDWIDVEALADEYTMPPDAFRSLASSEDVSVRALALFRVVLKHGFDRFDPHPIPLTANQFLERWPHLAGTVERHSFRGVHVLPKAWRG